MSLARSYQPRGTHRRRDGMSSHARNSDMVLKEAATATANYNHNFDGYQYNNNFGTRRPDSSHVFSQNFGLDRPNYDNVWHDNVNYSKRRKLTDISFENSAISYQQSTYGNHVGRGEHFPNKYFNAYCNALFDCNESSTVSVVTATKADDSSANASTVSKRDRSTFEDDEVVFMSRDQIDRCSPSRKDGIDVLHETHLRYSYCTFLQNLGIQLDLPQTTIGTAMVLCHRFFVHRSHASHDRFLIATAALFLASKSEETARPLNDVLRLSCEIVHKQDFTLLSYMFPIDWFEQYRERITEAEQLILTTLNFELNVQHPYESLTSTLQKLGFTQSVMVDLALNLVSEGVYRGLACSPYDIISWRLMCCSSNVYFSSEVELEISCGCLSHADTFMTCSLDIEDSSQIYQICYSIWTFWSILMWNYMCGICLFSVFPYRFSLNRPRKV